MLWATLVLITICYVSSAKEIIDNSCNGTEGCTVTTDLTEGISCIEHYNDIEMYVMNNKTLAEKLAKTFFTRQTAAFITGRGASQFVKIMYNFQTSNGKQSVEGNITNCSAQQSTYIWSEAVLYLVGPEALYWCTLFAVNIDEIDVTIELPCLCSDVYDDLLFRLTYLVCIYTDIHTCIIYNISESVIAWRVPYSGYTVRGLISAKHRFLCPAVISAITISAKQPYTKSRDRVTIATCGDVWS